MGKARLAPIKTMTIPRLELTAATVSTRMGHLLKSELDENPSFTYHTDSTTTSVNGGMLTQRKTLPTTRHADWAPSLFLTTNDGSTDQSFYC
ncbi:hypothetical protein QZH41_007053 [Actinostola sp. cb2023]|nr:hypothetical protein QZH41_007053 [Actinostola sp. cb2023]